MRRFSSSKHLGPRYLSKFLVVAIVACGQTAPPRETLPEAASVVPEPQACVLLLGESLGVQIQQVIADTGAEGVLEEGDLLVSVDGEEIPTATVLREVLATRAVGDSVQIVVRRDGDEMSQEVTLVSNPDSPDRPLLGVLVATAFEEVPPAELESEAELTGDFSRAASIGGQMYAVDPVEGAWWNLGVTTPGDNWAAVEDRLLTLENPNSTGSSLIDHLNEEELVFEIGEWNGSQILGTLEGRVVTAVTRPVEGGEEELVEVGVMLVNFGERSAEWIWPVTEELGLSVASFPSPNGSQLLIVGQDQETAEFRHTVLTSSGQVAVASLTSPAGAIGLGWYDDQTILVGSGAGGGLALVDIEADNSTILELPPALGALRRAWPVGDGSHLLAESGASLVRFATSGTEEIRTLADNCQVEALGDPGL